MKKKINFGIGILDIIIGLCTIVNAQKEIWSNAYYSWGKPYSDFEKYVITTKWLGIILLVSGIIWITCMINEIKEMNRKNFYVSSDENCYCQKCGKKLSKDTLYCDGCGNKVG